MIVLRADVSAQVVLNEVLADSPELVNSDPYGDGWLWRMRPDDATQVEAMMDAEAYRAMIEA